MSAPIWIVSRVALCLTLNTSFGFAEDTNSGDKELPTFSTPEQCYNALIKARKSKDAVAALACFADADRNQQVGTIAYLVYMHSFTDAKNKDAAVALLKANSLQIDMMGVLQLYDSPSGEGAAKAFERFGARVEHHARFTKKAIELLKTTPKRKTAPKEEEEPRTQVLPELKNVEVNGTTATGSLVVSESQKPIPIYFKKEEGSWRITSQAPENDKK